jgi:glycine/D-amino acid oxidase-like deaminating enzyme
VRHLITPLVLTNETVLSNIDTLSVRSQDRAEPAGARTMTTADKISLWDASATETDGFAPLRGDTNTTLAVIGGGFTGLSCALHAAEAGIDVQVIEARQIGFGGSGRNVGLVNAGLWLPPEDVAAVLGPKTGPGLVRLLGTAPDEVFALIEKHGIDCEAVRNGSIHVAHAPSGLKDLARRAAQWQRLGAAVDLLTRDQTAKRVGSAAFHGGLLDRRAGTINPMGYARGLARAATTAGARIATGTKAVALRPDGDRWQVVTDTGTITADRVVLATNAYCDGLWPGMRANFVPIHFFQLATEPLGDRIAGILDGGEGIWDTAPVMFSLRRDVFGRLVIGSMGSVLGGLTQRWAARQLRRMFPDLGPVRFTAAWHGTIAMTDELAAGADETCLPLPVSDPRPVPLRTAKTGFYHTAFAANQLWRGF